MAKATGGAEGAMIEKSCEKLEELMKSAGRLDLEIGVRGILRDISHNLNFEYNLKIYTEHTHRKPPLPPCRISRVRLITELGSWLG